MIKTAKSKIISLIGIFMALILCISGLNILFSKPKKVYAEATHVTLLKGTLKSGTDSSTLTIANSWQYKSGSTAFESDEVRRNYRFNISSLEGLEYTNTYFVYDGFDIFENISTSEIPVVYLEENKATHIYFEIPNETDEDIIASLDVRLTINGVPMDTGEKIQEETAQTYEQYLFYDKKLSTNYTDSTDNTTLTQDALMGLYTYTFTYTTTTSATANETTESISFYLISEEYYRNNNSQQIEPKLYNTQKNDRVYTAEITDTMKNDPNFNSFTYNTIYNNTDLTSFVKLREQNFFNYQNDLAGTNTTTDYFGNNITDNSKLYYPTYTYDASKYNLSWKHSLNGVTTNYTTEFDYKNNKVIVYENGTKVNELSTKKYSMFSSTETTDPTYDANYSTKTNDSYSYIVNPYYYITTISFDQVGEYEFTINPVVAYEINNNGTYELKFETANITASFNQDSVIYNSKTQSKNSWQLFGDTDLSIFGYQLYYTDYNNDAEYVEFKGKDSRGNTISADVSCKATIVDETSNLTIVDKIIAKDTTYSTYSSLFNSEIVTNQAPLSFNQYLATMGYNSSTLESKSYYIYFATTSSTGQIKELTSSTKFSSSGYYVLYLSYGYSKYAYWDGNKKELISPALDEGGTTMFNQVFAFQIRNTEPNVKMYIDYAPNTYDTTNAKQIYGNFDITNKNVLLTYTAVSQFDKNPTISIYKYEMLESVKDINNLDYESAILDADYKKIVNQTTGTISYEILAKQESCICFEARLQYGPNNSTSADYNFIIDTTPVESSLYKTGELNGGSYIITSNADETEFISTNSNFFFTYTPSKISGATITSSYLFIPLVKDTETNFDKFSEHNTNDFNDIYNGYKLSSSFSKYSYGLAKISHSDECNYDFLEKTNANYVLTNSGLYIFRFKDSAGNINFKVVLLDKSSPITLIDKDLKNNAQEYEILSGTVVYLNSVNIAYGVNKAINIDFLSKDKDKDTNAVYKFIDNESFFDDVLWKNLGTDTLNVKKIADPDNPENETDEKIKIFSTPIDYSIKPWTRVPEWTNSNTPISNLLTTDSKIYGFTLPLVKSNDEATYTLMAFDTLDNNSKQCTVRLTTDNSRITAYGYDVDPYANENSNGLNNNHSLGEFDATSNTMLYFSWINEDGKYQLKSLNLEYYPLTYDTNSKFYPYAENPTDTKDLLLNYASGITVNGNDTNDTLDVHYTATPLTDEGMYVVTRTYANDVSADNGELDTTVRRYIFFVDRNPIFSTIGDFVIGQTMAILVSDYTELANYIKTLTAQNFEQTGSGNTLFSTNKLPVKFNFNKNKLYKYAVNGELVNPNLSDVDYGNLMANVKYQRANWITDVISKTFALTITKTFTDKNNIDNKITYSKFTDAGNYSILLTDSTIRFSENEKTNATKFDLHFNIYEQDPTASFIEKNDNGYYIVDDNSYLNYSNNLFVAWNDPADEYNAVINPNTIAVTIIKNGIKNVTIKSDNLDISSDLNWDHIIDLNVLKYNGKLYTFEQDNEYTLEIYFEYYNNKGYSAYSTIKTINIDLKIPDENFKQLLEADKYLTEQEKQSINNYNSLINFENYTFTVDETFKLNYSEDYFNTQSIYYRYYNKYEDIQNSSSYINLQSVSPNDDRFDDQDTYKRLRFATDSSYYKQLSIFGTGASAKTFYEIVEQYGYYEIIEIDKAGNVRIFSIYLQNSNEAKLNIDYIIMCDDDIIQDITNSAICEDNENVEINSTSVIIDKIFATLETSNTKYWATIDVFYNNQKLTTIKLSPIEIDGFYTLTQLKNLLNDLFLNVDMLNGSSYSVVISYDSLLSTNEDAKTSFALTYNYPGPELEMEFASQIVNGVNTLYATVDFTPSTFIDSIKIESSDGSYEEYSRENGKLDNYKNQANSMYEFSFDITKSINLKFTITDNFNRVTYARYMRGMQDIATLTFTDEYLEKEDILYTAYQVFADFQAEIYKIEIFDNLLNTPLSDEQINAKKSSLANGLTRITLFDIDNNVKSYTIKYTDIGSVGTSTIYEYTVVYMPLLGTVNVKNRSGDIIFSNTFEENIRITTVNCYVFIDNTYLDENGLTKDLPFETFVSVSHTSEDGVVTEFTNITNGTCLSSIGKYILTIFNDLGVIQTLEFEIKNAYSRDITIIVDGENILSPSTVRYNYAGQKIDWYLTTSTDYQIQISDRYINYSTIILDEYTNLIELNSKTGENKYVALTIVDETNDFLFVTSNLPDTNNKLFIDETTIYNSTTLTSTNVDGFTLGLKQLYNTFEGNIISIYYTYNNSQKIKIIDDDLTINPNGNAFITFTEAGLYNFFFEDFAGNKQLFRTYDFYKVSLFSEVIALVNNQTKIQNAVYNSNVIIELQEVSQYSSTTFEINGTINGIALNEYKGSAFTKPNYYTFVFSDYGVYNITISGKMNAKTISTTFSFVILNEFEAYTSYEFIAYSNYEITKIVRDGVNVTEIIRDQLSKIIFDDETSKLNSISSIALSGLDNGIGGNGHYSITVLARNLNTGLNSEFTFNVWINAENSVTILASVNPGESTTNPITIRINSNMIYKKVGMCNILMNDKLWISIDQNGNAYDHLNGKDITLSTPSSETLDYSTYTLTATGNYNFKITTVSGNTLMSFTVTKDEPLNTVAILVIVLSIIAVGAITIIFVRMRKKIRVK